jgi:hypothetical protein
MRIMGDRRSSGTEARRVRDMRGSYKRMIIRVSRRHRRRCGGISGRVSRR